MLYYIIPAIFLILLLNYIGVSIEKDFFDKKFKFILSLTTILLICTLGINAHMLYSREQSRITVDKNHSYVITRLEEDMERFVLSIDDLMANWGQLRHEARVEKLEEVQAITFSMGSYERILFDYNWDSQIYFYRFTSQVIWYIDNVLLSVNRNNISETMFDEMYAISHDTKVLLGLISEANNKIENENLSGNKRVDGWAEYVDELVFKFKNSEESLYISKHVDFN